MDEKELLKILQEIAPQGKISCVAARELAEKLGVHPSEVGKVCNEYRIKILACELGCF